MNALEHVFEPTRLLLIWRCAPAKGVRTRRLVAQIDKSTSNNEVCLRYLVDTDDFKRATDSGFDGYPAFKLSAEPHCTGVIDAFMRRLPPRKRDDFREYLQRHRLEQVYPISDMALLAYTNAKLPSDGFELYPDLTDAAPPFELIIEVAGFRHQKNIKVDDIYIGDPVIFKSENDNQHDKNAIAIFRNGVRIGFVDRAQAPAFKNWLKRKFSVKGTVERINGTPDRPSIYVFVTVR